jgi:uncharacterized protein
MRRILWSVSLAAVLTVAVAAFGTLLTGGAANAVDGQAMILPTDPQPLVVETAAGERKFTIEVADNGDERARGLMFRQTMDDDHGMLFVFEDQRQVGFWMKNTPMPLDLVFIDAGGTVKRVLKGEPFSEAVITPGVPVHFVLELKAGVAAANGIEDGDKVEHSAISALH